MDKNKGTKLSREEEKNLFIAINAKKQELKVLIENFHFHNPDELWKQLKTKNLCDTNIISRQEYERAEPLEARQLINTIENIKKIEQTLSEYKNNSDPKYKEIINLLPINLDNFNDLHNNITKIEEEILLKIDKIFRSYSYLVVNEVMERYSKYCSEEELLDLIQEGNIGLMEAIKHFDYTSYSNFINYAQLWIWKNLEIAFHNNPELIHIPEHIKKIISLFNKVGNKIRQEQGREPTVDDYAKTMRISVTKVKKILTIIQTQNSISLLTPISLEDSVEDEENIKDSVQYEENIGNFIEDKDTKDPDKITEEIIRKEDVTEVLSKLSEREAKVIKYRFGLDCSYPRTLEEVGKMFNVTRERIRQIEAKAIRRLRHPSRAKDLKDFLEDTEFDK